MTKDIREHIGRTYKDGGDIRSTVENMTRYVIQPPLDPSAGYTDTTDANGNVVKARDQFTFMEKEIFKQEINIYVKRKAELAANMQKEYSLFLGQCTELMKSKLKTSTQWTNILDKKDVFLLLEELKRITFNFEEQKYPILSIHNAKTAFYVFGQNDLTNTLYLEKFRNLVDIVTSLGGNLHDNAIVKMVAQRYHDLDDPFHSKLSKDEKNEIQKHAKDMYLAVSLIQKSDPKRFGKLQEEIENDYTKGANNYPRYIIKVYQLLKDFKCLHSGGGVGFGGQGISFSHLQKQKKKGKDLECWICGKAGHTKRICPCKDKPIEKDTVTESKTEEKGSKSKRKESSGKKYSVTFSQEEDDNAESESECSEFGAVQMDLVCAHHHAKLDLKCILLDNESMVHTFCNKSFTTNMFATDEHMSMATNGGAVKTKEECIVPHLSQQVWYHRKFITNILSLSMLAQL